MKRSGYWWIFVISGAIWAIGGAGMLAGLILYPESNLLGGFGPLFFFPGMIGSWTFQITLVVWLARKWKRRSRRCHTEVPNIPLHGTRGDARP